MHSLQKTLLDWRRAPLFATSPDWRRLWPWLGLGILLYLAALTLRSWANLSQPGLYMEDAGHYFNSYYGGRRQLSFILQHPNGYYNVLNNLVAWLAAKADVRLQPLLYHLFSLGMGVGVAVCLACTGLVRSRAMLLVTPLALGLSGMNHIFYHVSLTFQMYNVVVLLLCLLFFPPPKTWAGTLGLALVAAVLIWSGPYSVVAVPAALLVLLLFPWDRKAVLCSWIVVCTLWYTTALEGGLIRFRNILDPTIQEMILSTLFGRVLLFDLLPAPIVLQVLLPLALVAGLFVLLRRETTYLKLSLVLFAIIVLSLAPLFLSQKILLYQRVYPCHIYIAQFFWVFFLLHSLDLVLRRQRTGQAFTGLLAALAVAVFVFADNRRHPDKGFIQPMDKIPAYVRAVHAAEQLRLEEHKQYLVLRTQNIDPRAAPASVRVGSRRHSATMADATVLPADGGREFIAR
ncbi:hypothetical protein [uncultured Desulfobulbus sp.]|uniref:hypothetical protein n=1 Tax=uncultured Desulfobulbus sp. TaxID=239745 RepID=UPI002636F3BC|nr:hypothetical protein [uncultured Desulfobulbus sp.]